MNWKKHKELIISLSKKGMSSSDIAEVLSKSGEDVSRSADRTIRELLNKWIPKHDIKDFDELPKVLLFDIETAPLKGYFWDIWQQNIAPGQIIDDWFMISWSAKWLFDNEVISDVLTSKEAINKDDKRITKSIWEYLNEADIVIGHNAIKFDVKRVNTRFLIHDLVLPSPYEVIDTLVHARRKLAMTSNRLDSLAKALGFDGKIKTSFELWADCLKGDEDALHKMNIYCDKDVRVLEDVYLKLRPYIQPHPNMGIYIADELERCPSCGSKHLKVEGTYKTTVNAFEALRCGDCGSISRRRKSILDKKHRKAILSSTPK